LNPCPLIHQQGIICGVAFDLSSLRRIASYASIVAPRRLASDVLLVIRNFMKRESRLNPGMRRWIRIDPLSLCFLSDCARIAFVFSWTHLKDRVRRLE
jgi:hypothetical protein